MQDLIRSRGNFLGDTNVIAANTITADALRRSTDVVYRLDR